MGNEKSCYSIIPAPGAEARKCGRIAAFPPHPLRTRVSSKNRLERGDFHSEFN